jgi:hypothetical protein
LQHGKGKKTTDSFGWPLNSPVEVISVETTDMTSPVRFRPGLMEPSSGRISLRERGTRFSNQEHGHRKRNFWCGSEEIQCLTKHESEDIAKIRFIAGTSSGLCTGDYIYGTTMPTISKKKISQISWIQCSSIISLLMITLF